MKEVNKNRKEEILSHNTDVNIDEIWAAIEPQVDLINAERKRKKRFLIFFLFGAILLASGSLYMWQNGNIEAVKETKTYTEIEDINETEVKNIEKFVEANSTKESDNSTQLTDNQTNKDSKITAIDETVQTEIINLTSTQKANFSKKNELKKVKPIAPSESNNNQTLLPNSNNSSQQINTENEVLSNEKIAYSEDFSKNIKLNQKPPTQITLSPQISKLIAQLPTSIPTIENVNMEMNKVDKKDNLSNRKLQFALSANTGISFINRNLSSTTASETSSETLQLRQESETLLEAIHYGLRGKLTHKSGFSISTGTQYTIVSERYDNNKIVSESDSVTGIVRRVVQLNGDTLNVEGTLLRTTNYDYNKQIYNRYKMIDIPFIVGFEKNSGKWVFGIQAGVFVNLALQTSGQIRSTATQDLNIKNNQSDIFKSKVGLSYYGGIYVRRALSPKLDITIAPQGRFFAQDFNVDRYQLKQQYSLVGVQVGLGYRF